MTNLWDYQQGQPGAAPAPAPPAPAVVSPSRGRTGPVIATVLVLVIAATAIVIAALHSNSVAGHASALGSGAPSGFPSGPASPSDTSTPSGSGVEFTYPAGHFRARFPATPATSSEPGSIGGGTFTVHLAQVRTGSGSTLIAEEDVSDAVPADQFDLTLRAAVGSFAGSSGLTLNSQAATSFRGHAAREASLSSPAGDAFTLVVTLFTDMRLYIFFSAAGDSFTTLTTSFIALP